MIDAPLARQLEAIEAPLGPVLVVAGPGAGKTFCLIGRIEHLIDHHGFSPERILAVTFTNKAAEEISARLKHSLGARAADITRGTLHAQCVEILRNHGQSIGLRRGFGIADDDYQRLVLRSLGVSPRDMMNLLPAFSRRRLRGHTLSDDDEMVFRRYAAELRERNVVDFDDLIALTRDLFEAHAVVAAQVASQWDYVLVDEFQDLNPAQFTILRHLVRSHRNLFGVGDEEQSIFSWTGADPEILTRFCGEFEISEPVVLDQNMRCSRRIFDVARRLLEYNPTLFSKDLHASRESAFEVSAVSFEDEEAEAAWLLADIQNDMETHDCSPGDYGVLYRRHRIGEYLEKAMVRAGMKCRLARGRSLQDDDVIGYVVASARVVAAPDDPQAVEVFAQRVLPDQLFELARSRSSGESVSFLSALRVFAQGNPRDHPDTKKAWRFVYHVENLRSMAKTHESLAGMVDELLAQRVGKYRNILEDRHDELSDPLKDMRAVALAAKLRLAAERSEPLWVDASGGVEIALRGMLFEAGFSPVMYVDADGPPPADAVVVRETDAGPNGLSLTVFKALQLMHSSDFSDVLRDYVSFDLETTDKDVSDCDIVEVGAARIENGEVVETFHRLVRPGKPVSARAQEVHGYSDNDLRDAPQFEEVWPAFRQFVGDGVLVAHNGQNFDVPVLRRVARELPGLDDLAFYDTLPLARSLTRESKKLEDLAIQFGVDKGRAHHALDDAITLARVFNKLSQQKIIRSRKSAMVNLLDYTGLAMALESPDSPTDERAVIFEVARPFALGRYSDCLEHYAVERSRLGTRRAPTVEDVIERLGGNKLMERIRAQPDPARRYPEAVSKLRALIEAAGSAGTLAEQIAAFLERVVLSTSQGVEVDPHRVNLLTLHSTKGLEFSRVYVVGVEDFELPGYYPTIDNRELEIEEARRLLYVGMTRAEHRLVLTRADRRFGNDTGGQKFLEEAGLVSAAAR